MSRAAVSALALLVLLSAVTAGEAARRRPAQQRVAIVPLSSNGAGAAQVAAGVVRAMVSGLKARCQVKVLDENRAARLRLCSQQPSCVQALGSKFGWTLLITGHVERQGKGFQLDLRGLSGETGEVVATDSRTLHSPQEDRVGTRLALQMLAKARNPPKAAPGQPGEPVTDSEAEAAAAILEKGDSENPLAARQKPASAPAAGGGSGAVDERPVRREPLSFGRRYWPSITCGAVGVASIGVAVAFGAVSSQAVSQGRESESQVEAYQLRDKARQNAMVANILFGVGGAALAASTVLLIFELLDARAERRAASSAKIEAGFIPGGVALTARGAF